MSTPSLPKRYEVRSLLGEGGSGRVYRVQDSIRDRELALKLVTPAESAFLRSEFDTLRQIRHENLIQVFDWGTLPSGEAYYTMELIEGGDWSRRMGKPQPADDVRHILTGLLRGLAHLHCHGEIHGDLKPGNILLGAGGVVKITDTGMGGGTGTGSGMSGTPGYAAPEVWEGATPNLRSDIYSVGVMGYEALTGKHPFVGHTVREVVSGQLEGWVPSPGAHGVSVPADLERVVMRALERKPGLRQGSADEFMDGFGVEDRVGEILGGKLVGREKEITQIEELLRTDHPGSPTLLHITGQPGVGRVALIEEVAQRSIARGEHSRQVDGYLGSIAPQIGDLLGLVSKPPQGVSELAESLFAVGPLIIWSTSPADLAALTPFARYAWALSIERQQGAGVLFVVLTDGQSSGLADFERELRLSPLPVEETEAVVRGFLGSSSLEEPLLRRVHDVSGGAPGALIATFRELIEQRIIARRGNLWSFRENQEIHSIHVPSLAGPWVSAWQHLCDREREGLAALALAPTGIPSLLSDRVLTDQGIVDGLVAKGWIRKTSTHLRIASEQIRIVVRDCSDGPIMRKAAGNLLMADNVLSREERADLAIAHAPTIESLSEGLWAAEDAVERSDYRLASARLERCLEIATQGNREKLAGDVSLRLADVLHKSGEDARAEQFLTGNYPWSNDEQRGLPIALREYQLGAVYAARGKLDEASVRFKSAISLASPNGELAVLLRSHAGLAEIEWQHRGGDVRDASIERIKRILEQYSGTDGLEDELTALTYGLGAALLRLGRRKEAAPILRAGLEMGGSEYWRMRLCNALSTAAFYSARASRALDWITEAWHIAEKSGYDSFKPRLLSNRGGILYAMGRFREALEQHELSSRWAMRVGSAFELLAACSGAAINLVLLAEYEQAIAKAKEGQRVAEMLQDRGQLAKAMEVEALALYSVGDLDASTAITRRAQLLVKDYGALEVKPRLDWLLGKIELAKGHREEAARHFRAAHSVLVETKDWEDLPGIQIEILRLESPGSSGASVDGIMKIVNSEGSGDIVLIQIYGGVALSGMIMESPDYADARRLALFVEEILGKAESVGALDAAWRLNLALGRLACAHGDLRTERARSQKALAIIREVAAKLSADHRQTYLSSPHVSSALSQISVSLSMN